VGVVFPTRTTTDFAPTSQKYAAFSFAIGTPFMGVCCQQATLAAADTTSFLFFSFFAGSATPGATFDIEICRRLARLTT
jgi:hypothetical protein